MSLLVHNATSAPTALAFCSAIRLLTPNNIEHPFYTQLTFIAFRVDVVQHSDAIYMAARRIVFTTEKRSIFVSRY